MIIGIKTDKNLVSRWAKTKWDRFVSRDWPYKIVWIWPWNVKICSNKQSGNYWWVQFEIVKSSGITQNGSRHSTLIKSGKVDVSTVSMVCVCQPQSQGQWFWSVHHYGDFESDQESFHKKSVLELFLTLFSGREGWAAWPSAPSHVAYFLRNLCTLRLEAMDQSQRTAHCSMLECVYMWQRPWEKVS